MSYTPDQIFDWVRSIPPSSPRKSPLPAEADADLEIMSPPSETSSRGRDTGGSMLPPPNLPRLRSQSASTRGKEQSRPNYRPRSLREEGLNADFEELGLHDKSSHTHLFDDESSGVLPAGQSSHTTPPTTATVSKPNHAVGDEAATEADTQSITNRSNRSAGSKGGGSKAPGKKAVAFLNTIAGMSLFAKPIKWRNCSPKRCCCEEKKLHTALPPGLIVHWNKIEQIIVLNKGIIPGCIKDSLAQLETVHPSWHRNQPLSPEEKDAKIQEFHTLNGIVQSALQCDRDGLHEGAWNAQVHLPLLQCAIKPMRRDFRAVDITAGTTIKEFTPQVDDLSAAAKVADFLLAYVLDEDMEDQIMAVLRRKGGEYKTLNQISQDVCYSPMFLHIETKRGHNDQEDARNKLSIWVSTWMARTSVFTNGAQCPPIPALLVFGDSWELYWYVDNGSKIEAFRCANVIGDTRTIVSCYRILAVLRYFCQEWFKTDFFPWFKAKVLDESIPLASAAGPSVAKR